MGYEPFEKPGRKPKISRKEIRKLDAKKSRDQPGRIPWSDQVTDGEREMLSDSANIQFDRNKYQLDGENVLLQSWNRLYSTYILKTKSVKYPIPI